MAILARKPSKQSSSDYVSVFDEKFMELTSHPKALSEEFCRYGAYAEAEAAWIRAHPIYEPNPKQCCFCGRGGDMTAIKTLGSGIRAHVACVPEVWHLLTLEARTGLREAGLDISSPMINAVKGEFID